MAHSTLHSSPVLNTVHKPGLVWTVGMGEKGRVFSLDKFLLLKASKLTCELLEFTSDQGNKKQSGMPCSYIKLTIRRMRSSTGMAVAMGTPVLLWWVCKHAQPVPGARRQYTDVLNVRCTLTLKFYLQEYISTGAKPYRCSKRRG